MAAFPQPAIPRADTRRRPGLRNLPQEIYEMAGSPKRTDSQKPAMKKADSQKPAKTAPTKTVST